VSRLLLDSTFLIDAERGAEDLDAAIDDDDDIAVAAITIAELRVGALLATGRRRAVRSAYVDEIAATARAPDRAVVTADRMAFVALTGVAVQPHR
jgi:predicted nucleic acid-binding protein